MADHEKTKQELLDEIARLRQELAHDSSNDPTEKAAEEPAVSDQPSRRETMKWVAPAVMLVPLGSSRASARPNAAGTATTVESTTTMGPTVTGTAAPVPALGPGGAVVLGAGLAYGVKVMNDRRKASQGEAPASDSAE